VGLLADKVILITGASRGIGAAAAWLLSDRSSYVAGVTLPVDGEMVAVRS
jgi:NAD(P)-dependent dehydrogenase (short-subunit alcohol dehydrogenase family)